MAARICSRQERKKQGKEKCHVHADRSDKATSNQSWALSVYILVLKKHKVPISFKLIPIIFITNAKSIIFHY